MLGVYGSKNRRHSNHERCGDRRSPLPFRRQPLSPCNNRDAFCGREAFGQETSHFEPRRGTFLGGLSPGPMGGLTAYGMLDQAGPFGPYIGGLGVPPVRIRGYGNDVSDYLNAGVPRFGGPLGGGLRGGLGLGLGSGLGGLRHGFAQRQPPFDDFNNPAMMQQRYFNLPRSPLLNPQAPYMDERTLAAYQRQELFGVPLAYGSQENLLRGGRMPMQMDHPLTSPAGSMGSGRVDHGMEIVPRMAGGLGLGGGLGNYRSPYVEDYESEVDEYERALREQEWIDQAGYFFNDRDDSGLLGRRI